MCSHHHSKAQHHFVLHSQPTLTSAQDPVNGAQLAGSWAVRETFIAVVTTNLPMVYPLFYNGLLGRGSTPRPFKQAGQSDVTATNATSSSVLITA